MDCRSCWGIGACCHIVLKGSLFTIQLSHWNPIVDSFFSIDQWCPHSSDFQEWIHKDVSLMTNYSTTIVQACKFKTLVNNCFLEVVKS